MIMVLMGGCTERYKTKEACLQEGLKQMQANNPDGAIALFKKALEKDPNFFEVRLELAKAYSSAGKWDSAEKELQKVLRQDPASRAARIELARVYVQQSKPDDALKEIGGLSGDAHDDGDVLQIAGWARALKGDYPAAIALLNKALSGKNPNLEASVSLARVYLMEGNREAAKSVVLGILKKEPAHREGLYLLAQIQAGEKDFNAALQTYERLIKINPHDGEALFKEGLLYQEQGKYDQVLSVANSFIEKFSKRPEGYHLKGLALYNKKNFKDAIVALQKSVSFQPTSKAYYLLGLCHYNENEPELAMSQLQRALDLDASFTNARVLISLILLEKNRIDDAVNEIRRALENDENNALAHNILGSAYMLKGRYAEGIEELNRALEIDPKLADVYIKKGLFELGKGRTKNAESELNAAVRVNPELMQARALLISFYMKQGEYDKAADVARQGIRGQGSDAVLYNILADTYARRNKTNDAVACLQKAKEADPGYDATYFKLAAFYISKGEQERGIRELTSLIEKKPDNVRALITVARIFESGGRGADALAYYKRAQGTGKIEGCIELAKFYLRTKDADRALGVVNDALGKDPHNIVLNEFKGRTLLEQKKFDDAIRVFEDVEKMNPQLGLSYLIDTYVLMKKYDKALDTVRKRMEKTPEDPVLMAVVSRIYSLMGKRQDAIENAGLIIRKYPESAIGYTSLAQVYIDGKDPEKAITVLRSAKGIKDENLLMMLSSLYLSRKDYSAALAQCRKAEETKKGYVPALFQEASIFHALGKKREAIAAYEKVLRVSSNYLPALNNLAYLYAEDARELPRALQLAARAYSIAPNDGFVQDTLGFVLLKNGKVEEGLKALQKAEGIAPANPTVRYHLALAYHQQGDGARAMENLQKAFSLGDFPEAGQARQLLEKLKKAGN